ncbi:Sporulation lipoprotein YhcN/YlaJ (Spore_YhcN_YlaJ) [Halobacillus karajensis]|uniref:Sporulation lipoprotein, YhcN/YlaJ family n=1 Tax=Halobacillus karajensis TaxID=195088 RepID=A0A024P5Y1_9BACI|nr:YhcN/YlaJ family sporulation lipoprotein [Halobacillus karajensis]CDQ18123.1 sporulation lipoprotein, YhcN/YlaJ family [Halobacillus karajensis]CDQ24474.1 sporulation lipoprotein, YhcN/YlaJ family [Halobacillus karajensis]CDQ29278.1 sporulation lipoprotein, YhcN/YlaJ family [Halobacillus karajensis]SEH58810.1 Sporulation lipoprotein YhcN/YlaJ (Spore_YhcN_YlaJ) [Halobacillus karajensis]
MWKIISIMMLASLLMIACQPEEVPESKEEDSPYEPLGYAEDGGTERRGNIPIGKDSYFKRTAEEEHRKSKYNETNRSHDNDFNNEDAMAVVDKVNELKEVTTTQAFSTDDHMYVAVMINPYDLRDDSIPKKIEEKVREVSDKKLTVYTNNNDWDNMKNFNSRVNSSEAPERLKERVREFFNQ